MQPPFWLNAAPRPIPVLPNSCMGGLHLAERGAAFINFHNIFYIIRTAVRFTISYSFYIVLSPCLRVVGRPTDIVSHFT